MRVAVTGGSGFIGSNLVRRLIALGHEVAVLDDLSTGLASNLADLDVRFHHGTIEDIEFVRSALLGQDAVLHLAARGSVPRSIKSPLPTHAVNASGTLNVLEGAREAGAYVIFSSSSSVYGANPTTPKTEALLPAPLTPYAASKLSGEAYVSAYAHSYGLDCLIFRFFNVFGPWQRPDHVYAAVIPRWIWAALEGRELVVNGSVEIVRDFTYVDDVVALIVRALDARVVSPTPVNLAFGRPVSLGFVLEAIRSQVGSIDFTIGPARPGDIPYSENNPEELFRLFPDFTPSGFEQALRATIHWLQATRRLAARD